MADPCDIYTLGDGDIIFNEDTDDTYVIEGDIVGLDGLPIRRTVVNIAEGDGGDAFDAFGAPRHIVIPGWVVCRSVDPYQEQAAFRAVIETLKANLTAKLDSLLNSDDSLTWSGGTLQVRRDELPAAFTGKIPQVRFQVYLLALDPVIT